MIYVEECEKTEEIRTSGHPSPMQIMVDPKTGKCGMFQLFW
jgi:hypothetical protein